MPTESSFERLPCLYCSETFLHIQSVVAHCVRVHGPSLTSVNAIYGHTCPLCGKDFARLANHAGKGHGLSVARLFADAESDGDPHGIVAHRRAPYMGYATAEELEQLVRDIVRRGFNPELYAWTDDIVSRRAWRMLMLVIGVEIGRRWTAEQIAGSPDPGVSLHDVEAVAFNEFMMVALDADRMFIAVEDVLDGDRVRFLDEQEFVMADGDVVPEGRQPVGDLRMWVVGDKIPTSMVVGEMMEFAWWPTPEMAADYRRRNTRAR